MNPRERDELEPQRIPVVVVCGATGVGKTTMINTLFGRKVGEVGRITRGTVKDARHVWEAQGEHIHVIDLPGLGDSEDLDNEFKEIYRRYAPTADGFILVTTPPRPAHRGTLDTVKTLLDSGVEPGKIIFALNRLSLLDRETNGTRESITINGFEGPTLPWEHELIEEQRKQSLKDLARGLKRDDLSLERVIPFDAFTGWNLPLLLHRLVDILPYATASETEEMVDQSLDDMRASISSRLRAQREAAEAELARKSRELEQQQLKRTQLMVDLLKEEIDNLKDEIDNTKEELRRFKSELREVKSMQPRTTGESAASSSAWTNSPRTPSEDKRTTAAKWDSSRTDAPSAHRTGENQGRTEKDGRKNDREVSRRLPPDSTPPSSRGNDTREKLAQLEQDIQRKQEEKRRLEKKIDSLGETEKEAISQIEESRVAIKKGILARVKEKLKRIWPTVGASLTASAIAQGGRRLLAWLRDQSTF